MNEFVIKNGLIVESGTTTVTGSLTVITGSAVELQVTNIGVNIGNAIGDIHSVTGSLRVSGSITGSLFGTASFALSSAGGITNFIEGFSSATQATSFLSASNAAATVNVAIVAKGTGALIAQVPDGTTAGGNARGQYAIDWQMGRNNANQVASGNYSVITGGINNRASGNNSFIGSGASLLASGGSSFVGSGTSNTTSGANSGIATGQSSTNSGNDSFIGGGISNTISNAQAFIGGGQSNTVSGQWGVVGGGGANTISANYGFIGGGSNNRVSAQYAMVIGGLSNTASVDYSLAAGRRAKAVHSGSFVWADSTDADYSSNGNNTFNVRALGGSFFTGSVTVTGSLRNQVIDITPSNQTASLNCSLSNIFTLTLSSSVNTLLTASNIQPGQSINLRIIQPATSGSLSYGAEFKFPNGAPYTASATSSVTDIVSFITFDSTVLYGSAIKNFI
jgi:hypothetical protein